MSLPEFKLIDGRVAKFIRKPKAIDASRAQRIAGQKGGGFDLNAALLAQIVEIDGQKKVMEDMLELDMDNFNDLIEVVQLGKWDAGNNEQPAQAADTASQAFQANHDTQDSGGATGNF